jgi:formamidopyrimidine-DNA glycosylase
MPEGDTIRRLADKITRRFAGERCARCVTRDPRLVGLDLAGRTLVGAEAVGKHLLIRFDDGRTLHAHLRMDGSFDVGPASREPQWRRRIELWMETGRLTAVDVPILEVVTTAHEDSVVGHLGPDLCAPVAPDLGEAFDRVTLMRRDPSRERCSTSATSPASGTSTWWRSRSCSGSRRTSRSARSTGWSRCSRWVPR